MRVIEFDKQRARAVTPSDSLLSATVPVRCIAQHGLESPQPYGCGFITENEDGIGGEAPMYWVSPLVARARGRGVKSGWYVVAKVGEYFDLHVANIKDSKQTSNYHAIATHIDVDGANPLGSTRALLCNPGKEAVVRGFVESSTYEQGECDGVLNMRRFRFAKARVTEDDNREAGVARVMLRISQGPMQKSRLDARHETGLLSKASAVGEKAVIKQGESVRVQRDGTRIQERLERAEFHVTMSELVGCVVVYIREKQWLQARNILDRRGAVWKPRILSTPVDLTQVSDDDDSRSAKKRRKLTPVIDLT